jgi:hypothetical protein
MTFRCADTARAELAQKVSICGSPAFVGNLPAAKVRGGVLLPDGVDRGKYSRDCALDYHPQRLERVRGSRPGAHMVEGEA